MLPLRHAHLKAFRRLRQAQFYERMRTHLETHLPDQAARAGPARIEELIRIGHRRALHYGIAAERDVCKMVSVMLVLGTEFDRAPWARRILEEPSLSPGMRMHRVLMAALDRLERGVGGSE